MKDELPRRIWTVEEYYQAKEFYDRRGLVFNPALERGSPAAVHVIAQAQMAPTKKKKPKLASPDVANQGNVFISYSHKDKRFKDDLLTHLKPLVRSGTVSTWSDKQIPAGSDWGEEIKSALSHANVVVMLVSPKFLESDFIHDNELAPALEAARDKGVRIIWTLIRNCLFEATPLASLQAVVSPPGKALAEMKAERDSAWKKVCEEIRDAVYRP